MLRGLPGVGVVACEVISFGLGMQQQFCHMLFCCMSCVALLRQVDEWAIVRCATEMQHQEARTAALRRHLMRHLHTQTALSPHPPGWKLRLCQPWLQQAPLPKLQSRRQLQAPQMQQQEQQQELLQQPQQLVQHQLSLRHHSLPWQHFSKQKQQHQGRCPACPSLFPLVRSGPQQAAGGTQDLRQCQHQWACLQSSRRLWACLPQQVLQLPLHLWGCQHQLAWPPTQLRSLLPEQQHLQLL